MIKAIVLFSTSIIVSVSCYANNGLLDNGNGTVSHLTTGLMWQKTVPVNLRTFSAAVQYCDNLELADVNDWRLPELKEALSILDFKRHNPAIDTLIFPQFADINVHWAQSSDVTPVKRWVVRYNIGGVFDPISDASTVPPRCVRSL